MNQPVPVSRNEDSSRTNVKNGLTLEIEWWCKMNGTKYGQKDRGLDLNDVEGGLVVEGVDGYLEERSCRDLSSEQEPGGEMEEVVRMSDGEDDENGGRDQGGS